VIQALNSLVGLPRRAREWRVARRDRSGQAALRDSLAQYFGGRYTRAQRSAQRALAIQVETPELAQDNEFTVLGHLLAAGSTPRPPGAGGVEDGAAAGEAPGLFRRGGDRPAALAGVRGARHRPRPRPAAPSLARLRRRRSPRSVHRRTRGDEGGVPRRDRG